ncbi:MAG: hypothetical protein P4L83_15695, partial [Nevskia sp.]|nr:hypothetical protein [Nevskia sp.]
MAHIGPALAWLAEHRVPTRTLQAVFGVSPGNVRQITSRGRKDRVRLNWNAATPTEFLERELGPVIEVAGVRRSADERYVGRGKRSRNDWLRQRLDEVDSAHRAAGTFADAIPELTELKRVVGHVGEINHIRLKGELLREIAWFSTQAGLCTSAFKTALRAAGLYQIAWREAGSLADLGEVAGCLLIASNACLLSHAPDTALSILDVADQAVRGAGPGDHSDHHRQRGVALLQKCDPRADEAASKEFQSCGAIIRERAGDSSATHRLNAQRAAVLSRYPDFEGADEILHEVSGTCPASGLEAAMAANWACAVGLSTDSADAHRAALEILAASPRVDPRYGHQWTVRNLLAVTLELGLS